VTAVNAALMSGADTTQKPSCKASCPYTASVCNIVIALYGCSSKLQHDSQHHSNSCWNVLLVHQIQWHPNFTQLQCQYTASYR